MTNQTTIDKIQQGCKKQMHNYNNRRVQEHYQCGEIVQTGWGMGYKALCKECREKIKVLKEEQSSGDTK